MNDIVILTATYNHPKELRNLYRTLALQNDLIFTWVIVDDGSREETDNAIHEFIAEASIDIRAIRQENSGKSAALNNGLNQLESNVKFIAIIDDDEILYPNAVQTIKAYYEKYIDQDCAVIHFNRENEKHELIANPPITDDMYMPFQQFKSEGRTADGYIGYFMKHLGTQRFSMHDGEKYISPSTLFMRVTQDKRLLWASAVLGSTEYLEGGITKQGRRLRVRNPLGMVEYCELMQGNGASLKTKFIYSVMGYAYAEISGKKYSGNKLMKICLIPGTMLAGIWKSKIY